MEIIRGKKSFEIEAVELTDRLKPYNTVLIDIGAGDGRFVRYVAAEASDRFAIGLDACRENLRAGSRLELANALFVIASAQAIPAELSRLATHVTINFPWGSLLESLLDADPGLLGGLRTVLRPAAKLDLCLNAGALAEAGWCLEPGARRICQVLASNGFDMGLPVEMDVCALRAYPTTWAKRLAFGRDPRAVRLSGQHVGA